MVFEDNVNPLASIYTIRLKGIAYILDLKKNTVSKSRLSIKRKTGVENLADVVKPFIN